MFQRKIIVIEIMIIPLTRFSKKNLKIAAFFTFLKTGLLGARENKYYACFKCTL